MKTKSTALYFLLSCLLLFIAFFTYKIYFGDEEVPVSTLKIKRLESIRKSLLGTEMDKVKKILSDSANTHSDFRVILYYRSSDCSSCVHNSFEVFSKIFKKNNKMPFAIISNDSTYWDKIPYIFDGRYVVDRNNLIPEMISYSYTPVYLILNQDYSITGVFHITSPVDLSFKNRFTQKLKKL